MSPTLTYGVEQNTMPTMSPVILIIYLAIAIFEIAAIWKIFAKAGQPGWAAIIPIYNITVLLRVCKMA